MMLRIGLLFLALVLPPAAATEAGDLLGFDLIAPQETLPGRGFGRALAVSGDLAVIGAASEQVDGKLLHGAAYVFQQIDGRWRQRARLDLTGGSASSFFGTSVAIAGNQILVGARGLSSGQVLVFEGAGANWSEVQRFTVAGSGQFGYALAVDGERLLVGAPEENGGGAAYVFERSLGSWSQQARLLASNRSSGDKFGREVALDGDYAAVAAPFRGANSQGAAYVFERLGTWSETAFMAPSVTASAYAGWALALEGSQLLIGSPGHNPGPTGTVGAAFRYLRGSGGWLQQQVLAQSLARTSGFGRSLALENGRLVIGADRLDRAWGRRGVLFDSELGGQGFSAPLPIEDAPIIDRLGEELALHDGRLLAGSSPDRVSGTSAEGRVASYQFDGAVWRHQGVLEAPRIEATRRFGRVVAISGTRAAIGIPWQTVDGGSQRGAVQVFEFDGQRWQPTATVVDPIGVAGDRFGSSVALDGERLLVGAPRRSNGGTSAAGSALLFEFDGAEWVLAYRNDNPFEAGDTFGTAVALDGDRAAIGSPGSAAGATVDAGYVLVLERGAGGWSNAQYSYLFGAAANERLGKALAFDNGTLVAGAPDADVGAGRVRIYRKSLGSWSQLGTIPAPPGAAGFGYALDIGDGILAIGAPFGGDGLLRVYREQATGFVLESLPATSGSLRNLGTAVAVDDGLLLAGSMSTGGAPDAFHVFERLGQNDWHYRGRRDSPDGAALFPDGFGSALALQRPLLLTGAEWRVRDEGRVFAFIEPVASSFALSGTVPALPVSGELFDAGFVVGSELGAPLGTAQLWRGGQRFCSAIASAGSGQCTLGPGSVGTELLGGRFLPDQLPWLAAEAAPLSHQIVAAATSLSLAADPVSPYPGQALELLAQLQVQAPGAGNPSGLLHFHADSAAGPLLCSVPVVNPRCQLAAPAVGNHDYVVRYAGDDNFQSSESPPLTLVVQPWPTSVTRGNLQPEAPKVDQTFTLPVSVTAAAEAGVPSGRVRLLVDGAPGPWVALDSGGQAAPVASAAQHGWISLRAEFDGEDGGFADSLGSPFSPQIVALSSQTTLVAAPDAGIVAGDSVRLDASVLLEDASSATGNLRIYRDSLDPPAMCTLLAPSDSCNFVPPHSGMFTLFAVYEGDSRAAGSSGNLALSVARAPTQTNITTVIPSTPRVDQDFDVWLQVSSSVGPIQGTVQVSDGSQQCLATVDGGSGICTLSVGVRGPRTLNARFVPSNDIHSGSEAEPFELEIAGIPTLVALQVSPQGPYSVGDSITITAITSGSAGDDPDDGLVSLRRHDAQGPVICLEQVEHVVCSLELSSAGVQTLWAGYGGSPRHAPSQSSYPVTVDALDSVLDWYGTAPSPVVAGQDFVLQAGVGSSLGIPPGRMDFSDQDGPLCVDVEADPVDGRYRCAVAAVAAPGSRTIVLAFRSDSPNYLDATRSDIQVEIRNAIRLIRVELDDGTDGYLPGIGLEYLLTVRNLAVSGTVPLELQTVLNSGLQTTLWYCVQAVNGAVCPREGAVAGVFFESVELPPASHLQFLIEAQADATAPDVIELGILARLPANEENHDEQALYAVDVNLRLDSGIFNSGFEPAPPAQ